MTVFRRKDLALLFGIVDMNSLKFVVRRMKQSGVLFSPLRGIWCLPHFDVREMAMKLHQPSYISLYTVLQSAGAFFQDYSGVITCVSDNTSEKKVDGVIYRFRKIHERLLSDPLGIRRVGMILEACPERALCDMVYLTHKVGIDNSDVFDQELLFSVAGLYPSYVLLFLKKYFDAG